MKQDVKYLKKMEIIIKSSDCRHESYTTVYVDSTIADALITREPMLNVDSVEFVNKSTGNDWWYARRSEVNDLIEYLRSINTDYWRML